MRMCPLRSLARCWVRRARCASSSVRTGTPAEERGRSFGVRERTIGMQLGAVPYDVLKANGGGTPEKFHPNLATPIQRCGYFSRYSREFLQLELKVPDPRLRPAILMPKHQAREDRVAPSAAAEGILGAANRPTTGDGLSETHHEPRRISPRSLTSTSDLAAICMWYA